jgi:signal transduction histidine kinase
MGATGTITFRRSLLLKLILAFWVVSIFGIVIVALLAGRVSQVEFGRFINETRSQGLVDQLSSYYTQHGSFTGAGYLLEAARSQAIGLVREYVVVDVDGNVLLALAQHLPPGLPSPDFTRFGFPITSNSHVVAYLIPMRPPRSPADSAVENLQRINFSLFVGVVFATLVALIFALVMARNITRPLRNLNAAAQSIAQGNFENQVAITTRDEIGALASSFNQMVASLKLSRDLRRQMTADIAHELRNPLSIILGNAEALSDGVLPATHETLEIIYDEAKHLSRLVDDLRTLSLSESGELPLQLSLAAPQEIINRCASAYAIRAAEKGVTIRAEASSDLPCVNVDVERIVQVLANLVDNSLKHTPSGGSIILAASYSQNGLVQADDGQGSETEADPDARLDPTAENGEVFISVEDSGFGILPEDLPFVFDRFYRGKQLTGRLLDGSGLGLAISRAMVELHGGKVSIESQPGKGTKITISLPVPL